MQNTTLVIQHRDNALPVAAQGDAADTLVRYAQFIDGVVNGSENAAIEILRSPTSSAPARAAAIVAMATSSGTVGATINGVAVTVTWATSDANSCALLAAAINSSVNALVQGLVTASNQSVAVTVAATTRAGDLVNFAGYEFEGVTGTPARGNSGGFDGFGVFDISSGVANTIATNLAAAINAHPAASRELYASASAAVVTVYSRSQSGPRLNRAFSANAAARLTLGAATFGNTASCLVQSTVAGKIGNAQTIAASGTNVSIVGALTRLGGGAGLDPVAGPVAHVR